MSANTDNIRIGKGIVYFKKTGETDFRDLGYVPSFEVTPDVTTKEYISAREGISTVAKEFVTKVRVGVKFRMDEINGDNLSYFALGTAVQDTDGAYTISTLTSTQIGGILKCVGANEVGQQVDWIGEVTLRPSGTLNLLTDGDDFSGIEMEGAVVKNDSYGGYGQYSVRPQGVGAV